MNSTRKPNAMLIELVIVILFFALSASIILQLFVAASNRSVQSATDSSALIYAEDFIEQFSVSTLDADAFLREGGFESVTEGEYARELEAANGRPIRMVASGDKEIAATGELDDLSLQVYDGGRVIVHRPVNRAIPTEVTP